MRITQITAIQLPSGNAGSSRGAWSPVLVRVDTDEGISGWGEAGLAYGKGWRAAHGILQDFGEVVVGEDPLRSEAIWEKVFRKTFWGLGGGTVVSAGISAIDIALWDIRGKALGVPVHVLLGGKTNPSLRVYASQLQFDWRGAAGSQRLSEPEQYAIATRAAVEDGYDAIKVDPVYFSPRRADGSVFGPGEGDWIIRGPLRREVIETARARISAMREAGGPDMDIILEMHSNTDTISAIELAEALAEYRIFYYEEPAHPLNVENFASIKAKTSIPLATGERLYGRQGFRPYFERRLIDVAQPDLCLCGGFTEAKKICDAAWTADAHVQIHVCGSPISKAAALQIEAAIPNFLIHEHHQRALDPAARASCIHDWQPVRGRYEIPDLPGIGQEPDPALVAKATSATIAKALPYMR